MFAGADRLMRSARLFGIAVVSVLLACLNVWAMAALYLDFSPAGRGWLLPATYLVVLALWFALARRRIFRIGVCFTGFLVVLACWLSLKPSNDRNWQRNLSQTPWAEIAGDRVTIHNF
jgi:apolipoprotein N-acyltransferase